MDDLARTSLDVDAHARPSAWSLVRASAPAVAVVTVVLVSVAALGTRDEVWQLVSLVLLAPTLAAISVVDWRTHRVPNALVIASAAIAVVTIGSMALATQSAGAAIRAVITAGVVGLVYLVLWRFAGLGLGDVKLAVTLALVAGWVSWRTVVLFVLLAHLLQVPAAVWLLVRHRRERIAFAPALVAGLYLAVVVEHLA